MSNLFSAVLALALVYLFFKAYKLRKSVFLLGLPVGFLFLAMSYVFLGLYLESQSDLILSESFLWLRLVTQTCGFAFIGFSYFFSTKVSKITRYVFASVFFTSVAVFFCVLGILFSSTPLFGLPSVQVVDEAFRITGLAILTYIVAFLIRRLETQKDGNHSELVSAPIAFAFLWIAQYSCFVWGIDGSLAAFVGAHIANIVSLVLFLRIYYLTSRGRSEGDR